MNNRNAQRVVVIGGGIAGLVTAITLAPHFEQVIVLERDRYPDGPAERTYAPQNAHIHVLLARGLERLTQLIPEFPTWLDEFGLVQGDLTRDIKMRFGDTWLPRVESGIALRPCTRPVIEHLLIRAARQHDNVELREGAKVEGFALTSEGAVRGLRLAAERGEAQTLDADLVVGAGGRSMRTARWLAEAGVETIREEVVDAKVTYSSCRFRPPPGLAEQAMVVGNSPRFPDVPVSTVVMRVTGGDWLTAVVAYGDSPPPRTVEELLEILTRGLPDPYREGLRAAEPLSKVQTFTNTANRLRRFAGVTGWPERFVVVGDAACTLNPRYGQGMTVATLGAETLERELTRHWARRGSLDGLASRFQAELERTLAIPWQMALMEDRLWVAHAEGRKLSVLQSLAMKSSARMTETVFSDIETYIRFMRVAHMIETPMHLMHMGTLAKVLFPALRGTRTGH